MKNLKDYKIDVSGLTEDQRAEVQKAAFKLGYDWNSNVCYGTKNRIKNIEQEFYLLNRDKLMNYGAKIYFSNYNRIQITPQQLIDMAYQKTKPKTKPKPKPKNMAESFTFAETILFIMDCKKNNAMPGRDTVKKLCGVNDYIAKKAINIVKSGFDIYFHSQERRKRFKATKSHIHVNERLTQIHDADLANFAERIKV